MPTIKHILVPAVLCGFAGAAAAQQQPPAQPQTPPPPMSFFVTSVGKGDGANLGGLAGADAHCQSLAAAVGAGNKTWHAYLSTQGPNAVNARDRIGQGPWYNSRGAVVAKNLADLHGDRLTMPSYFITGEADVVRLMDPSGPDRMRALLPGYRGETIIPGAGHWVQQEAPDAFDTALLGFLADL